MQAPRRPCVRLCEWTALDPIDSRGLRWPEATRFSHRAGSTADLFVVRRDAAVFAYENRCPHTGAPLDWAPHRFLDHEREFIQCAMHGALFEIETGRCVHGPCAGQRLKSVPVRIEADWVVLAG